MKSLVFFLGIVTFIFLILHNIFRALFEDYDEHWSSSAITGFLFGVAITDLLFAWLG